MVKITKLAFKIVTYPILGNLSGRARYKLENILGKEWFDAEDAYAASMITNLPLYGLIGKTISEAGINRDISTAVGMGLLYGAIESAFRCVNMSESVCNWKKSPGSLIGKIVSYPIEYIGGKSKWQENL